MRWLGFLTAVLLCLDTAAAGTTVRVGLEGGPDLAARRIATFGGESCPAIDEFPLEGASRLDAELLLLCNALRAGGPSASLELVPQPNYNRALAEAIAGRIDIPSQTIWASELDEHAASLMRSLPVIQAGEWQVGLFTTANRADVLRVGTLPEIRRLTAAAPRGWVEDWRALSAIGFSNLLDIQNSDTLFHMIEAGRVDVTLQRFSGDPDMGWQPTYSPLRILPIPGFKVGVATSRHFALSRQRPDAQALLRQLDAGLTQLRASGALVRVLERNGVLEARVANWQVIGNN